jgi:integrase
VISSLIKSLSGNEGTAAYQSRRAAAARRRGQDTPDGQAVPWTQFTAPEQDASFSSFEIDFDRLAKKGFVSPKFSGRELSRDIRTIKRRLLRRLNFLCRYERIDNDPRSGCPAILITSSEPEEGKTFLAVNLALSFTMEERLRVLLVDEDRRERYLNPNELTRLVETLNEHPNRRAANAVRLLLLTGARRGEVLAGTWEQFDLEAGIWTKPSAHTKQKRSHRVPLSAPARALLDQIRTEAERSDVRSPFLFPGDVFGKPLSNIKLFWRSVCRRAGIEGLRLHDLRHQYASMLASAGLSLAIIGRLLGHTQPSTTARYAHLFDDPLREATERVGALVQNTGNAGGDVVLLRREQG